MSSRPLRICPRHGLPEPDSDVPDDGFRLPAPAYSPGSEGWEHIDFRYQEFSSPSISDGLTDISGYETLQGEEEEEEEEEQVGISRAASVNVSPAPQPRALRRAAEIRQMRAQSRYFQARLDAREERRVRRDGWVTPPPPPSADVSPPSFETATSQSQPSTPGPRHPPPPPPPPSAQRPPSWSEVEAEAIVNRMLRPAGVHDSEAYTRYLVRRTDDGPVVIQMWGERVTARREAENLREERRRERTGRASLCSWQRAVGAAGVVVMMGAMGWLSWEVVWQFG